MIDEQPDFDDREFLISRYLDDDLTAAERRELERSLDDDPALARLLETYHRTDALVRSLRDSGPELDWGRFTWEVRRRREAKAARERRYQLYRLYAPLAAAAVVVLVCTAYFTFSPARPRPIPQVIVQVHRPPDVLSQAHTERVVVVRPARTPPPSRSTVPPSGKSYVIAAAGAKPFERLGTIPDANPYF